MSFVFCSLLYSFIFIYFVIFIEMDMNDRLHNVEQSSTNYVHQAEKFHAEATHVNKFYNKKTYP